uniref:Clp ATPase C-terminal domain-containing protein n=1 Tax=Nelumbo nucifera TaxID=4432 RepID=A0A822Y1B5_NELNU|nr:TPA_asm: hypothetical protein HUJ06_026543 [Nelumbo nucifera]
MMVSKMGPTKWRKWWQRNLKKNFRPEFLNRWDEVIMFKQLTKLEMRKIAEKFIKDVLERFKVKNIKLQVTDELKDMVVEAGYEPSYGARSLRRAITKHVEDELANKMLRKEIKEGDTKVVTVDTEGKMIISDMFTDLLK